MITIPMLSPDLSQSETILQIADVLEHLERVTDSIFDRIGAKIDENQAAIQDLNSRIEVASKKVATLKTSDEHMVIHSSPEPPVNAPGYVSCLNGLESSVPPLTLTQIPLSRQKEVPMRGPEIRDIQEKLQFYHVRPKALKSSDPFDLVTYQASATAHKSNLESTKEAKSSTSLLKFGSEIKDSSELDGGSRNEEYDIDEQALEALQKKLLAKKS